VTSDNTTTGKTLSMPYKKESLEEMLHKKSSRKNSNLVAYNEPQPTYDLPTA
jgi:hypothetical protein